MGEKRAEQAITGNNFTFSIIFQLECIKVYRDYERHTEIMREQERENLRMSMSIDLGLERRRENQRMRNLEKERESKNEYEKSLSWVPLVRS